MDKSAQEKSEIVDSIRLEASALSPRREAWIRQIGNQFGDILEQDFGKYISPAARIKGREAINNLLVVESVDLLSASLLPKDDEALIDEELIGNKILGIHMNNIDPPLISIKSHQDWDSLSHLDQQEWTRYVTKNFPEVSNPDTLFQVYLLYGILAHEVSHAYTRSGRDTLPKAIREPIADYFANHILRKTLHMPFNQPNVDFFKKEEKKFGRKIYPVMFGSPQSDPSVWLEMYQDIKDYQRDLKPTPKTDL